MLPVTYTNHCEQYCKLCSYDVWRYKINGFVLLECNNPVSIKVYIHQKFSDSDVVHNGARTRSTHAIRSKHGMLLYYQPTYALPHLFMDVVMMRRQDPDMQHAMPHLIR